MNERLYQPHRIREVMETQGLQFKKSLGQNFLIDGNIVRRIVTASGVSQKDTVLEIGPGVGTLTEELLQTAGKVVSVELDRTFAPVLKNLFGDSPHFHLVEGDALKLDLSRILSELAPQEEIHVVANVPYYITTPLLARFFSTDLPIQSVTVLVQKEVAERMTASPGSKTYGALSLMVQLFGEATLCFSVPRTAFLPEPKVDSAVVTMKRRQIQGLSLKDSNRVNDVIRLAFQQRRKVVSKAIARATGVPDAEVRKTLVGIGQPSTARAENLSLADYVTLLQNLGYIPLYTDGESVS